MRKVLIITYYWPPSGGGGVQRWLKFTKFLPDLGWAPIVYAPENADYPLVDHTLEKDIAAGVTVVKYPIREPRRLYRRFARKKNAPGKGAALDQLFYTDPEKRSWKQKLGIWVRGNLFIPDARVWWVGPSVRFLIRYLAQNEIDTVVTTGPPHSMHLIGLALKRKDPGISWIADFRDPWTSIEFYDRMMLTARADRTHRKLERQVLQTADAVVTVSPSWAKMLGGIRGGEVTTITNGFDQDDFNRQAPTQDKQRTICHIGTLALDRNPEDFWRALKALEKEEPAEDQPSIKLMGSTDPAVLKYLEEIGLKYTDLGYVTHDRAVREMRSAHFLLLLINQAVSENVAGRIPGKIFEYLAADKPIIGICPEGGDAAQLLKKHGHLVLDPDAGIDRHALQVYLKGHREATAPDRNVYRRAYLAQQFAELLDQVTRKRTE